MPMIPIDHLRERADNANEMSHGSFRKLVRHIERTNRYPTIIVRPIDENDEPDAFEILDGHHRVRALRQLGRDEARCDVWEQVDDAEALLLLTTLNRLAGQDDPVRRSRLVTELVDHFGRERVGSMLPESADQLDRLLELDAAPPPMPRASAQFEHELPEAITFFLSTPQRAALETRLADTGIRGTRSQRLVALLNLDSESDG